MLCHKLCWNNFLSVCPVGIVFFPEMPLKSLTYSFWCKSNFFLRGPEKQNLNFRQMCAPEGHMPSKPKQGRGKEKRKLRNFRKEKLDLEKKTGHQATNKWNSQEKMLIFEQDKTFILVRSNLFWYQKKNFFLKTKIEFEFKKKRFILKMKNKRYPYSSFHNFNLLTSNFYIHYSQSIFHIIFTFFQSSKLFSKIL